VLSFRHGVGDPFWRADNLVMRAAVTQTQTPMLWFEGKGMMKDRIWGSHETLCHALYQRHVVWARPASSA
jgi:hypothetical protein